MRMDVAGYRPTFSRHRLCGALVLVCRFWIVFASAQTKPRCTGLPVRKLSSCLQFRESARAASFSVVNDGESAPLEVGQALPHGLQLLG